MKSVAGTFLRPENEKSTARNANQSYYNPRKRELAQLALKEEAHVRQSIVDKACRAEDARRLREHSDFCAFASVLLPAFHHSASGRLNKPLMRNGCYSCPSRYFCAITIYHICLPPPFCALPVLPFFPYDRHRSVLSTTAVRLLLFSFHATIGRLYDVDDETTSGAPRADLSP